MTGASCSVKRLVDREKLRSYWLSEWRLLRLQLHEKSRPGFERIMGRDAEALGKLIEDDPRFLFG